MPLHVGSRYPLVFCGRYSFVNSEASTLVAAMTTPPSDARKGQIDALIGALKTASIWTKLDVLYVFAAHDSQAACLNWKSPSTFTASVAAGSPTFTADRGYTGDGATAYLDSGFNPSTAGGQFTRDSAHMGVWSGTDVQSATQYDIGNSLARIDVRNGAATAGISANDNISSINLGLSNSIGWVCWSRADSASFDTVKDLGTPVNQADASTGLTNAKISILAHGAGLNPSSRRIQAAHWGSAIDDTARDAFYSALLTYMQAMGAA